MSAPQFTRTEIELLIALVSAKQRSGEYCGIRDQYYKRVATTLKKLKQIIKETP